MRYVRERKPLKRVVVTTVSERNAVRTVAVDREPFGVAGVDRNRTGNREIGSKSIRAVGEGRINCDRTARGS